MAISLSRNLLSASSSCLFGASDSNQTTVCPFLITVPCGTMRLMTSDLICSVFADNSVVCRDSKTPETFVTVTLLFFSASFESSATPELARRKVAESMTLIVSCFMECLWELLPKLNVAANDTRSGFIHHGWPWCINPASAIQSSVPPEQGPLAESTNARKRQRV